MQTRRACVGLAGATDAPAIDALRYDSYAAAPEFLLRQPDALRWDVRDASFRVCAGWDAVGQLVTTMQGRVVADVAEAEARLGISAPLPEEAFPALILSRAATLRGQARGGLNTVLRWHFMQAAISARIRAQIGLAYASAPRLNTMRAIGYEFTQPARVWDPEVEPLREPLLAYLPAARFEAAGALLGAQAEAALRAYAWIGPPLDLSTTEVR